MRDWKIVKLGELLTESKIESSSPDTQKRIRVKLNLGGIEQRPDVNDKEGATKYYIRKSGQFIYGRQNLHKGAFGIIPPELDGFESSSDIPAFDVGELCYPEWIFYFFKQGDFYLKLETLAKGVGSKRIHPDQLFVLNIPLPTKEEQREILNEIVKLESNLLKVTTELDYQISLVRKLKSTRLQEAVEGILTASWRKENKNITGTSDLLDTIISERKRLIKGKKIKDEKLFKPISSGDIPFDIPEQWVWCRYKDLLAYGTNLSYGVLIPGDHVPGGIPLIRAGDIDGAEKGIMPNKYISKSIADKYKRTTLLGGEILIVVVGSVGKVALVPDTWKGANIARAISRTVLNEYISKQYFMIVLESPYMQNYFLKSTRTVAQPTLNIGMIESALIPLPPAKEQNVIAKKIEDALVNFKKLETQIQQSRKVAQSLPASYLNEIFGDVPNDFTKYQNTNIKHENGNTSLLHLLSLNNATNYVKNNMIMELEQLLKQNGKMSAINLWKMSKFENDIDAFYEELKKLVEGKKIIKESNEKGFLELVK